MEGDRQPGEIRVNSQRTHGFFVYQCKEALKSQDIIELHGIGAATTTAVRAAEVLSSLGYATTEKFETTSISDSPDAPRKIKVYIKLKKSPKFEELYREYEATNKQENSS